MAHGLLASCGISPLSSLLARSWARWASRVSQNSAANFAQELESVHVDHARRFDPRFWRFTIVQGGDSHAPGRATLDVVRRALEAGGVEFIDENGEGAGVRLRKSATRGPRPFNNRRF
jgi:hypothetical protein